MCSLDVFLSDIGSVQISASNSLLVGLLLLLLTRSLYDALSMAMVTTDNLMIDRRVYATSRSWLPPGGRAARSRGVR